jgi:hypothetical protein
LFSLTARVDFANPDIQAVIICSRRFKGQDQGNQRKKSLQYIFFVILLILNCYISFLNGLAVVLGHSFDLEMYFTDSTFDPCGGSQDQFIANAEKFKLEKCCH